jgi:hypothetical protein
MEQMNIFDYVKQEPDVNVIVQKAPEKPPRSEQYEILDKKYKLSRKYKDEDGWPDDWHYSEMELPAEPGIYFAASPLPDSKYYNFRYLAFAHKHWWVNVRTDRVKWYLLDEDCFRDRSSIPFSWMMIPEKYRTDESLNRLYDHFVSEVDWKHERLMKAIEQHKQHYYSSDNELIVIDEDERFNL